MPKEESSSSGCLTELLPNANDFFLRHSIPLLGWQFWHPARFRRNLYDNRPLVNTLNRGVFPLEAENAAYTRFQRSRTSR